MFIESSQCLYAYRNPKTLEIGSGTKLFITFLSLRFFGMRRERDTVSFYADFSIWPPPQITGLASASSESRPSCSEFKSQLTAFFQIPKYSARRFRAWRYSRPRSHDPIWGFYCDICDCRIHPRARVNTCTQCVHLTNPCTKPKGSQHN